MIDWGSHDPRFLALHSPSNNYLNDDIMTPKVSHLSLSLSCHLH